MARTAWALLAGVLLAVPGPAGAADVPAGNYKVTFLDDEGRPQAFWIVKLERADGKWGGSVVATAEGLPPSKMEEVSVTADRVRFVIRVRDTAVVFEAKPPADGGKRVFGTLTFGRQLVPSQLEATTAQTLDASDANRDIVNGPPTDLRIFQAALELMAQAGDKKAKPEEVRGWADKVFKAAELYGPQWQREVALRSAEVLLRQEGLAGVAVEQARRAERLLEPGDKVGAQMRVLRLLAQALKKAGKDDEAKEAEARLAKLDFSVKPEKFAGRKAQSDRAVLVELFTGAECPPCVAADLAFDALGKTYKPAEVVLLQYHLHIPRPDPLTNADAEKRGEFYGVEGTPSIYFDGKPLVRGGGGYDDAPERYKQYRSALEPLLEKPAGVQLKAAAAQKGTRIDIAAEATSPDKPGEDLRLRLVLVEEQVNYTGSNGLKVHHHVVRALPGGVEGVALKDKTTKQVVSLDLDELRKGLKTYLDDFAKAEKFPNEQRPLDLKNLRVVAFVQNDKTKEVLQAVQAEVRAEK